MDFEEKEKYTLEELKIHLKTIHRVADSYLDKEKKPKYDFIESFNVLIRDCQNLLIEFETRLIKKAISQHFYIPEQIIYQNDDCYPDEFIIELDENDLAVLEVVSGETAIQNELDFLSDDEEIKDFKEKHITDTDIGAYTKLRNCDFYCRFI